MTTNELASTLAVLIAATLLAISCGYAIGFAEGQRLRTTQTECKGTYVYTIPFKGTFE
jgi:hypothetical protein